MNSSTRRLIPILACCLLLAACGEPAAPTPKPAPSELTREDTGYFCGMIVEDHAGPKSQIKLADNVTTLWFTTARDGIAFQRLPEETRPILVFYVTAIDRGGWEHPEGDPANMIEAHLAWYVIGSSRLGSMGAPETIPFSTRESAESFVGEFGGEVKQLADIPDSYILGPPPDQPDVHAGHDR